MAEAVAAAEEETGEGAVVGAVDMAGELAARPSAPRKRTSSTWANTWTRS